MMVLHKVLLLNNGLYVELYDLHVVVVVVVGWNDVRYDDDDEC